MQGVRFSGEVGWEGLCPKMEGGCGEWVPLTPDLWDVLRTLRRCRACEQARLRDLPDRRQKHAALQRRYRRDPAKQEQYRAYGRKYRAKQKAKTPEVRAAEREREAARRHGLRQMLQHEAGGPAERNND